MVLVDHGEQGSRLSPAVPPGRTESLCEAVTASLPPSVLTREVLTREPLPGAERVRYSERVKLLPVQVYNFRA